MKKRRFSEIERAAVFKAHNGRCHVCGEPCTLSEMQIDHVIPESIAENPEDMKRVRELFALPVDFKVNAFENWAPAHSNCNRTKADIIYVPSLVVQHVIEKARRLGPEAKKIAEKALSDREIALAKSALMQAREKGQLSDEDFKSFASELLGSTDEPGHQASNLDFLKGIISNATLLREAFKLNFVANRIEVSVNVVVNKGVPRIDLIAKHRRILRLGSIFEADVEIEMTTSTGQEALVHVSLHEIRLLGLIK